MPKEQQFVCQSFFIVKIAFHEKSRQVTINLQYAEKFLYVFSIFCHTEY